MIYFILRRTFQSVLTVLGVVTFTFFLVRLAGDPTALLLPVEASDEDIARLRAALGLDQSWIVQYWKFLANAVSGDFGVSLRQRTPALDLVLERLPATLELALTSFVLGMVLAFGIGLAMRLSTSARLRSAVLWLALARQAIPVFSFGLILILIFSVWLRWLPSLGRGSLAHLVLPSLTLATYELALYLQKSNHARARMRSRRFSRSGALIEALPQVKARLDGIWGERDATAYPHVEERARLLRGIQKQARFAVVPGAGHWVQYEAADRFNPILSEYAAG